MISKSTGPEERGECLKVESNFIDQYIKRDLKCEMVYRSIPWTVITITSYMIMSSQADFSLMAYYKSSLNNALAIINFVFPTGILLLIAAAIFKDMEVRVGKFWKQEHAIGKFGAIVRKISSEFLLWGCGVSFGITLITMVTALKAIYKEGVKDIHSLIYLLAFTILLIMIFAFCSVFYIQCRKEGATYFQSIIREAKYIPIVYVLAALFSIGAIYIGF